MSFSKPNRVVVIEGPNNVGKSTVAAFLAQEFGGTVMRFSSAFVRTRDEDDMDRTASPLTRLQKYLDAVEELSERCRSASGTVIVDRYFASPIAMLEAEGNIDAADLSKVASPVIRRLCPPTVTILLTADHSSLVGRSGGRDKIRLSKSFEMTMSSPVFSHNWSEALRRWTQLLGPVEVVDTTAIEKRSVCEICHRLVRLSLP